MSIDDIVEVPAKYPYKALNNNIELKDELLNLEQLPQLLTIGGVKNIKWKYKSKIIGPDLSIIQTDGEGEYELVVKTPLNKVSIPWTFSKVDHKTFLKLIEYLVPCKEGNSLVNLSPWTRYYIQKDRIIELREGEIGNGRNVDEKREIKVEDKKLVIDTHFLNPQISYINPYYIQKTDKYIESTYGISIELDKAYSIVSNSILNLNFDLGKIKAESDDKILLLKTKTTEEAKLNRLAWDIINDVTEIECKPPFQLSLYRIEPASITPLYVSFNENAKTLTIILENFSNRPVISTLYLSARISKVIEPSNIISYEYDRVKIPIRRWGIVGVVLEIKRLPDLLLKRKAI
ncbi:MAG: hypothetical protein QW183_03760 [Saccharolobus sp.]